jgi:hypothetical protein
MDLLPPAFALPATFPPLYTSGVPAYAFTPYFHQKVMRERPYLTEEMCISVIEAPLRIESQEEDDRFRFWGRVEALGGRYLRVVTLADKLTIHNAFLDRRFRP